MSPLSRLPRGAKVRLKSAYTATRQKIVRAFFSYGASELSACLRALGVRPGATVMLHSAFAEHFGFRGNIEQLTQAFLDAVGPEGNLLMVSLPYRTSSLEYLLSQRRFDVRHTPSMMGLVSELFRRRPDVIRSLHPTHPILACGPKAEWIVGDHANCVYPCGPQTPFDRMLALDGQFVFFNVPFATLTFFHYLEHRVSPDLPFRLYTDAPYEVPVIDRTGELRSVTTFVFSPEAIRRRRFQVLEAEIRRRNFLRERTVGTSRILAANARDIVQCVDDMRRRGIYFYDFAGTAHPKHAESAPD